MLLESFVFAVCDYDVIWLAGFALSALFIIVEYIRWCTCCVISARVTFCSPRMHDWVHLQCYLGFLYAYELCDLYDWLFTHVYSSTSMRLHSGLRSAFFTLALLQARFSLGSRCRGMYLWGGGDRPGQ